MDRIGPALDRRLIHDCYSCREGRGTLFGIRRAEKFLRSCTEGHSRRCWVLRLDISGYFMAIDRSILWSFLQRHLEHLELWKDVALVHAVSGHLKVIHLRTLESDSPSGRGQS
jgi:hypothetical protein